MARTKFKTVVAKHKIKRGTRKEVENRYIAAYTDAKTHDRVMGMVDYFLDPRLPVVEILTEGELR